MTYFKNLRDLLFRLPTKNVVCMIVSEQEGAEVWLDGQFTGKHTPALLKVPQDQWMIVQVKMLGHETVTVELVAREELNYYYCELKRIPLRLVTHENCLQVRA